MGDFGIKVSANGSDAKIASGKQLIMSSKYPLAKLDRTNPVSFQNIRIQFNNNLPLNVKTLLYQFPHGYNYVPSTWTMVQSTGIVSPYYDYGFVMDSGGLMQGPGMFGPSWYVSFLTEVDATNVYYYAQRLQDTVFDSGQQVTIAGVAIRIRTYVFVEDVNM